MKKPTLIAAGTVLLAGLSAAPALAAANGPKVSVRIEGLSRSILPARTLAVPGSGSITKDGVAAGDCPADSAQGALNVATKGDWKGTWYPSYKEYEISSIAGVTPNAKRDYFEIFVNDVAATAGACDITLRSGDSVLFAEVPDAGRAETPLGLSSTKTGSRLVARVVAYDAKGRPAPLKGATVKLTGAGTQRATTNARGIATFDAIRGGHPTALTATAAGHIRDEITVR